MIVNLEVGGQGEGFLFSALHRRGEAQVTVILALVSGFQVSPGVRVVVTTPVRKTWRNTYGRFCGQGLEMAHV